MIDSVASFLQEKRIVVCVGTGGVGKTTTAAALALRAAELGRRTLVITVDPSQRLADALGINRSSAEVTKINDHLDGIIVQHDQVFDRFLSETMQDEEKLNRILKNRLYLQLKNRLAGSQDFTSLEVLDRSVRCEKYDLIVLDTPPAQNAIDFFRAPQKLHALFDSSVTKWFLDTSVDSGLFKKILNAGSEKVLSALQMLTGPSFVQELKDFFELAQFWQKDLSDRVHSVHQLLTAKDCFFLMVTGFDDGKLKESLDFKKKMQREGFRLNAVLVNRIFPFWSKEEAGFDSLDSGAKEEFEKMSSYYNVQKERLLGLANDLHMGNVVDVMQIPLQVNEPDDVESLLGLSSQIQKVEK